MRPVCFIVLFTVGVSLMVFSGYLPQAASARGNGQDAGTDSGVPPSGGHNLDRPSIGATVTRKVSAAVTDDGPGASGDNARPAEPMHVDPPESPAGDARGQQNGAPPAAQQTLTPIPGELPLDLPTPTSQPVPGTVGDEPVAGEPPPPRVVAEAGPNRVVWSGWDEVPLDGSGSTGENLSYRWKQVGGPLPLVIKNDALAVTTASGLVVGEQPSWRNVTYKFELTVADPAGEGAVDTVQYMVKSAPALRIKPAAERRFEVRDGYQLAHFAAWATNLESYESTFEISSETELTFAKVTGGTYTLSGGKAEKGYVYQVTLYAQAGEGTWWVEFLVHTDEKIPGIVQLGVSWDGR